MAVYKNLKVDIPKEHVIIENRKDGKPALVKYVLSAVYDRQKGYAVPKRTTIGHQCPDDPDRMNPTGKYREIFPDRWKELTGTDVAPDVKRIGLFAFSQAVNARTGIKNILNQIYGHESADALMDYALYLLSCGSDGSLDYQDFASEELLYGSQVRSDFWYAELFSHRMSEQQNRLFRRKWALQCHERGVQEVLLVIDGSNEDGRNRGVELVGEDTAKADKNKAIVSFALAVTKEGLPVSFDCFEGGLTNTDALQKILTFLSECGITVKGVILERGYCTKTVLHFLSDHHLPYLFLVTGECPGIREVTQQYGPLIRMNAEYLIEGTSLFGIQKSVRLFPEDTREDFATLYYDCERAGADVAALLTDVGKALERVKTALATGEPLRADPKYSRLIHITTTISDGNTVRDARIVPEELQKAIDEKGLFSIVSSEETDPTEIQKWCAAPHACEAPFGVLKGKLGFGSVRLSYSTGITSRALAAFVTSVLRFEAGQAKGEDDLTEQVVEEVDSLSMKKIGDVYACTHADNREMTGISNLFSRLGADAAELLEGAVKFENSRLAGKRKE